LLIAYELIKEILSKGVYMKNIRIGSGAGYAGDRIEPAVDLIKHGELDYICFECLAERTIALANQRKLLDPNQGYDDFLVYRMEHVLELCVTHNTKLISNMGSANPVAAAQIVHNMAKERELDIKVAAVYGDDILSNIEHYMDYNLLERKGNLSRVKGRIISANTYLGAKGIVEALENGADIVITGRVADPSLFLAPLIYEFAWSFDDYKRMGKGLLCGHLLECSSQVCGGYFADPGYKEVPNLAKLGFPMAEVNENGDLMITKLAHSGGMVTEATIKEQILYEIQDPSRYYTPDAVADFSHIYLKTVGKDRVKVENASGSSSNGKYKVSIGYKDGYLGEGQISYGGSTAYEKAKMAGEIIEKRLKEKGFDKIRVDYIGVNSLFNGKEFIKAVELQEIRLRVCANTDSFEQAKIVGNEVEALYLNGPSGGGGAEKVTKEIIAIGSIFVDQEDIPHKVSYFS